MGDECVGGEVREVWLAVAVVPIATRGVYGDPVAVGHIRWAVPGV